MTCRDHQVLSTNHVNENYTLKSTYKKMHWHFPVILNTLILSPWIVEQKNTSLPGNMSISHWGKRSDLETGFWKLRTDRKYVTKVQRETQLLMSIPDHKNFYRPFYAVTALLDWKHYENYMAQSIYQSSEFWDTDICEKPPSCHIHCWKPTFYRSYSK